MGVLEIIAEQRLGAKEWEEHPQLRAALERIDQSVRRPNLHEDEKARIASLVELCFAYERESDPEEKRPTASGSWKRGDSASRQKS